MSILAEDGRLDWDDPVTKHLPEFQMYDPWVTREVTLRDLVTHRAGLGLGQGDLMWWPSTEFTRREIVRGIRHLKPVSSLRSRYAYSNVMYVAAGEVVAEVSGRSWDDFLRERIFVPLGMARSNTSVASNGSNVATPHLLLKGRPSPVAPMQADNCGAAGAINSSASDMARWLRMLLECGRRDASGGAGCVLKPDSIRRLWSAQIALATPDPPAGLEPLRANFAAYGLGFGLRDYRGCKLVTHTGGLPGYVSQVALVPEQRLGLVILTNQEEGGAFRAVMQGILDDYLGAPVPAVDWTAAFRKQADDEAAKARAAVDKAASARAAGGAPSLPLATYVGRYRDPWYGDVTIVDAGGTLVLSMTRHARHAGGPRALAARHLRRALARGLHVGHAARRRLRELRAQAGRLDRADDDGTRVAGDRLQLRLPGPAVHARRPGRGRGREGELTLASGLHWAPDERQSVWTTSTGQRAPLTT